MLHKSLFFERPIIERNLRLALKLKWLVKRGAVMSRLIFILKTSTSCLIELLFKYWIIWRPEVKKSVAILKLELVS